MASKPHILVADNDNDALAVTTAVLERLGYNTQGEAKSFAALKTFSDDPGKFDLIIIEPVMPDLSGIDLAVRVRPIRRGCPAMFYSGYTDRSLEETIKTAGLPQALPKPLGSPEMGEAVREALPNGHANE
ncbi:MAG TPA: response regulator [Syntrophorhabdaceae bacterium]|nr:response regulator [Syntrophorhabdaceae bacterium]